MSHTQVTKGICLCLFQYPCAGGDLISIYIKLENGGFAF